MFLLIIIDFLERYLKWFDNDFVFILYNIKVNYLKINVKIYFIDF